MPNPGFISGTHHLTFCVGGAQEDYDFHVRTLGLKSVKKTVLFDGEIPIYHLYYANRVGDASTILTALPVPPGRLDGQARDQPGEVDQPRRPGRVDRLLGRPPARAGIEANAGGALRHRAARVRPPMRHPVPARRRAARRPREPYGGGDVPPSTRSAAPTARPPRSAKPRRWTSSCARRSTPAGRLRRRDHQYELTATATAACWSSSRSPTSSRARGASARARSTTTPSTSAPPRTSCGQGLHRRPRLHRRLRRQGPRLLLQRLPAHPRRRAVRARLLDRGGLHDRRARGTELGTHMCIPRTGRTAAPRSPRSSPSTRSETVKD